MMNEWLPWVVSAIIAPVPLFHLWLHALLPWWKKRPLGLYLVAVFAWIFSILFFKKMALVSSDLFSPNFLAVATGYIFMAIGILAVASSMITLGPKRFFVWAVLRPESAPHERVKKGPFHFVPHPAYLGYIVLQTGNVLVSGELFALLLLLFLITVTPIVIRWEEEEMLKRLTA